MIEVLLSGDYLGTPHDIGAWAYVIRRGEELLGQGKGSDRPKIITSRLTTEAAALALSLEDLAREWNGEDVAVRTSSAGLQGLLIQRGTGVPRDLAGWYARIRDAAARLGCVRILPVDAREIASLKTSVQDLLPRAMPRLIIARASELGNGKRARL
jgi:hypothetical protein